MNWYNLLKLRRLGDTKDRPRITQDDTRLGFEVDYDRIIFSSAFRSLQDKTQIIPFSKTDFVHTRLTHSLEVSVVGRSLGRMAGKTLPGNRENYVAWIHLEDIVKGIEFVQEKGCHGVYNLVNDMKLNSKELCDLICDRQQLERVYWDDSKPSFSSLNARVDNSKIKQEGYQFIYADTLI